MKKVLLIIPAFNEENSIKNTIDTIVNYIDSHQLSFALDYLVINDGSLDNTEKVLIDENINHISLINNLGIGGCVQTGYKYASANNYDIAVQFDGDGQHDINSIEQLVNPILYENKNFTIGSRFVKDNIDNQFHSTTLRRIGIKLISSAIKLVTGYKVYDTTSGYRAADRSIIAYFSRHYPVTYPEPESIVHLLKRNYNIKEVAVNMFEREEGKSSISSLKSITYMIDVLLSVMIIGFVKRRK